MLTRYKTFWVTIIDPFFSALSKWINETSFWQNWASKTSAGSPKKCAQVSNSRSINWCLIAASAESQNHLEKIALDNNMTWSPTHNSNRNNAEISQQLRVRFYKKKTGFNCRFEAGEIRRVGLRENVREDAQRARAQQRHSRRFWQRLARHYQPARAAQQQLWKVGYFEVIFQKIKILKGLTINARSKF